MKKAVLTTILMVAVLALLPGLGAAAGPSRIQMSIVPADAQWVLHLDMEKLVSSALFKVLTEEKGIPDIQQKAGQEFAKLKIDPFKDIKGVTLFGRGEAGEEPVVAISGNFDKASLIGLIKAATSFKETPYGKSTVYSWQDKNEAHFGTFATDNLILITSTEADIKSALDAIEGKTKNVAGSPLAARLGKEPAGAIVEFAVADIARVTGQGKGAAAAHEMPAILSQMQSVDGAISEIGDKVNLNIAISAISNEVAKNMEQAVQGIIALVNLNIKDADAQMLTQGINVKVDGEKVRVNASYPIPELTKLIQKQTEKKTAPAPEAEKKN